jgi:flagellar basal body-associated protein FliL
VSFAIVSLLILVVVVIVAVLVLMRVFGEAARRNPNSPGGEDEVGERDRTSGPGRE